MRTSSGQFSQFADGRWRDKAASEQPFLQIRRDALSILVVGLSTGQGTNVLRVYQQDLELPFTGLQNIPYRLPVHAG